MILDIYSRYAVGWMLATRKSAALAEKLIADTCANKLPEPPAIPTNSWINPPDETEATAQ